MGKDDMSSCLERMAQAMAILHAADNDDVVDPGAPSSLYECYDDNGDLDLLLHFRYTQRMARREEAEELAIDILTQVNFELAYGSDSDNDESEIAHPPPTKKRLICRPQKSPSNATPKKKVAKVLFPAPSYSRAPVSNVAGQSQSK